MCSAENTPEDSDMDRGIFRVRAYAGVLRDDVYDLYMPNGGTTRILLVDDEQSVQTLLSYPLRKDGYHVTPALDGREALERFKESHFDLVVLDLMLPKLDGVEVCRQ